MICTPCQTYHERLRRSRGTSGDQGGVMDNDLKWLREKIEARKNSPRKIGVQLSLAHAERIAERLEEMDEFKNGMFKELHEVENILAETLDYPHDEDYGWVIGDHTGVTLAMESKDRIKDLEFMRGIALDVLSFLQSHVPVPWWIRKAFGDALAFEHHNQSKQKRERDDAEASANEGMERPQRLGRGQPEAGE
jgi:hypothetical protein